MKSRLERGEGECVYGGGGGDKEQTGERGGGAMKSRLEGGGERVWVKSGWVVGGGGGEIKCAHCVITYHPDHLQREMRWRKETGWVGRKGKAGKSLHTKTQSCTMEAERGGGACCTKGSS